MATTPNGDSLPTDEQDIDEQWEKFSRDGCPDWWLMAKYTGGWLSRTLPYMPFRDARSLSISGVKEETSPAASAGRSQSGPGVELQQVGSHSTPQGAANVLARSDSLNTAGPTSMRPATTTSPTATDGVTTEQAASSSSGSKDPAAAVVAHASLPSPAEAAVYHGAALRHGEHMGCGNPLKGLLSCASPGCVSNSPAHKAVDQQGP